jgi:Icc-related predicted phosphoesterase
MKVLVIGDLHGQKPVIKFNDFDCIVQIGDVCDDKGFRPYLNKIFKLMNQGKEVPGIDEFMISQIGKRNFIKLINDSVSKGHDILQYLNSFGKSVFFVPGNWDESYGKTKIKDMNKTAYNYMKTFNDFYLYGKANKKLMKGLNNVHDCHFKGYSFNGINFIGYGLSSGPELLENRSKSIELTNSEIKIMKREINKLYLKLKIAYNKLNKKYPLFFISHNVPFKTKLDVVKNKNSYAHKMHLGSSIARKFCLDYKPLICVGGHIHEGVGKDKLGKTLVLNPGYGKNAQVLINIDDKNGKIKRVSFYKP